MVKLGVGAALRLQGCLAGLLLRGSSGSFVFYLAPPTKLLVGLV